MAPGVEDESTAPRRGLVIGFQAIEPGLGRSSLIAGVARWLVAKRAARVFLIDRIGGPRGVAEMNDLDRAEPMLLAGQRVRLVEGAVDGALLAVAAADADPHVFRAPGEVWVLVDLPTGSLAEDEASACDLLVQVHRPDLHAVPALEAQAATLGRMPDDQRPWTCAVLTPVDRSLDVELLDPLREAVRAASVRPGDPAWVAALGPFELPWQPAFGLGGEVPEALRRAWSDFAERLAGFGDGLVKHRAVQAAERERATTREGRRSVFLSYRRASTRAEALALSKTLRTLFPELQVFVDEESLWPGDLWQQRLDEALNVDALVLVMMGPTWWTAQKEGSGQRLIDDPEDWCRREVEAALERGAKLVPVLVQGVQVPKPEWLPEGIRGLADHQALSLSGLDPGSYVEAVREKLEPLLGLSLSTEAAVERGERETLARYLAWLAEAHDRPTWSLPGVRRRFVEEVFVEVEVGIAGRKAGRTSDAPSMELDALSGRRSFRDVLAGGEIDGDEVGARCWVVLGEPGAGKSTLARHIVREVAADPAAGAVPVYLPLPLLAAEPAGDEALFRLVETCSGVDGVAALLLDRARDPETAPLWLFLDGLDEVAPGQLAEVTARLHGWAKSLQGARIAVFSRIIGYQSLGAPYRVARMQALSDASRRRLLGHWVDASEIDNVLEKLAARPTLSILCGNPLLLTLIAQLAARSDDLPEGRLDLYDQSIDLLLERPQAEDDASRLPAPSQAREVLAALALELQSDSGSAWQKKVLKDALRAARKTSPAVDETLRDVWGGDYDRFLRDVASKTGLLEPDPSTQTTWTFAHRQFREYLAAEALVDVPGGWKSRVGELDDEAVPRWSETLGLFCGMTDEPHEVLDLLRARSPEAFVKALPEVEGLPIPELAELLWGFEPRIEGWKWSEEQQTPFHWDGDDLSECLSAWVRQGRWARAEALDWLWSKVSAEQPTVRLAWLAWALQALKGFDDSRFFADCGRERPAGSVVEFLEIPEGSFLMGSPEEEPERFEDEGPQHQVHVGSFRLAKYAVTNEQYAQFDPSHEPEVFGGTVPEDQRGSHPVVNVCWWQAWLFSEWLGARLPSEAEWEYACRAGTTSPFSFEGELNTNLVNYDGNHPYADGPQGECRERTVPVGELPPNPWGLHEMHGNVWEWCEDRWHANYDGAPDHGAARIAGSDRRRVLRGGSWAAYGRNCRSASRFAFLPGIASRYYGFRPARSSD